MSHFTVLVSVEPPLSMVSAIIYSKEELAEIAALRVIQNPDFKDEIRLKELTERASSFEREVEEAVTGILAPFNENTEDSDYLEFVETGTRCRSQYETESVLQIRMPDGNLCFEHDTKFTKHYRLYKGKVYHKDPAETPFSFGYDRLAPTGFPLKEFEVIEHYPLKDLYPTFEQFMEEYCGESFNEEQKAYGYYHNPNAKWDWWQLGGRWQHVFLVPEDRDLVIYGGSGSFGPQGTNNPTGYRWVAGARKSDILWEKMRELELQRCRNSFQVFERWFLEGVEPKDKSPMLVKTEDGIRSWDDLLYKKGDTLHDYLKRMGVNPEIRFPCTPYAFIDDDGWHGSGDMGWFGCSSNKKEEISWNEEVDAFIASVPDDHFLVSVDCHI